LSFFFSSRRRHTSFSRDWSSDVCSSDLQERVPQAKLTLVWNTPPYFHADEAPLVLASEVLGGGKNSRLYRKLVREEKVASNLARSEERRVGDARLSDHARVSNTDATNQT